MKRILHLTIIALALFSCTKSADCGRHGIINEQEGWFIVKDITPSQSQGNIWMISEHGNATCYLVTGSKYAMLIDTGIGVGDLAGLVRGLTDLPLIVVNTHGHPDHVGANYQFTEVWFPEKDLDLLNEMNPLNNPDLEAYVESYLRDFEYDRQAAKENIERIKAYKPYKLKLLTKASLGISEERSSARLNLRSYSGGTLFVDESDRSSSPETRSMVISGCGLTPVCHWKNSSGI